MGGRSERGMRRGHRVGGAWRGVVCALAGSVCAAVCAPTGASAQEASLLPAPRVGVTAGAFLRDGFHGEGSSTLFGLRVRLPLSSLVVVEPGASFTSFTPDTAGVPDASPDDVQLLLLDFQLQFQLSVDAFGPDRLRPWVGAGLGAAADFRDDRGTTDFLMGTLSGSLGASFDLGERLSLLAEVRIRAMDELDRRATDAVLGLAWSM